MTIKVLDLFCGAGGSSLGARNAGAQIQLGIDAWPRAIASYKLNFNGRGTRHTLGSETDPGLLGLREGQIQMLLASPECTNHTCAKGAGERSEESRETANYVLRFVDELKPRWVVIENVIHMKGWQGYGPLVDQLREWKYGVTAENIDSSLLGVPQTRLRHFLLCERYQEPTKLMDSIIPKAPVGAWSILDYDRFTKEDKWTSCLLDNGRRAKATLERFERGYESIGGKEPFLIVYYGSDGAGGWQDLERPLRTITTLDRFGLVTWKRGKPWLRMLQVDELKRAMGIKPRDKFQLSGTRREQIMQIGNGVAPPVMAAIVKHLTKLNGRRTVSKKAAQRSGVIG